jgi:hypothetical protein
VSRDGADKFSIFIARLIASVDREFLTPSESPSDFTLVLAHSQLGVVFEQHAMIAMTGLNFLDSVKRRTEGPVPAGAQAIDAHVTRADFVRLQPQFGSSLNPRPLRIIGKHFSARAALVFACFADETWKMSDFPPAWCERCECRPENRVVVQPPLQLLRNWVLGRFFRSIFVPDSSKSMAS